MQSLWSSCLTLLAAVLPTTVWGGSARASWKGMALDAHSSFSNPRDVNVADTHLQLTVDFEKKVLSGTATLTLHRSKKNVRELFLDTRTLDVAEVRGLPGGQALPFAFAAEHPIFGSRLAITLRPETEKVEIRYRTRPETTALQWLSPATTASKKPLLYAQTFAIFARSWFPCQDTPSTKMTYSAEMRVPKDLMALMSARNPTERSADGVYRFVMPEKVPSYLVAFAVGDFAFRPTGPHTGIYAEPTELDKAAKEFADLENVFFTGVAMFGPYQWERYDVLVLPPSFPYGGMENPRLTFLSPTLVTGDRSLVTWIAHEFGHSWAGNLVTNAAWNHFWLNEGINTYLELRLVEHLYGKKTAETIAGVYLRGLHEELTNLGKKSPYARLVWPASADLDPEDAVTEVPYIKGYLFLRMLENAVGRPAIDAFLQKYFTKFAFRSIGTDDFLALFRLEVLQKHPKVREDQLFVKQWLYDVAFPPNVPVIDTTELDHSVAEAKRWQTGGELSRDEVAKWSAWQRVYFLQHVTTTPSPAQMAQLREVFAADAEVNPEILSAWYVLVARAQYRPSYALMESFLRSVGRPRSIRPVYRELAKNPDEMGLGFARRVFAEARAGYHARTVAAVEKLLRTP